MKKRKGLLFLLSLLFVLVVGIVHNNYVYAATVGNQLLEPEDGWRRYDDMDPNIEYSNNFSRIKGGSLESYYNGTAHVSKGNEEAIVNFKFRGNKLRIISPVNYIDTYDNMSVSIDGGKTWDTFSNYSSSYKPKIICYENTSLEDGVHEVIINVPGYEGYDPEKWCIIDAIDINSDGELFSGEYQASVKLNKTSINLIKGYSQTLSLTTNNYDANIVWKSSNESVAIVDAGGKVTAVGIGKALINAKIEGTDISDTCEVTVTTDCVTAEPNDPDIQSVDDEQKICNLNIEMVNGNIKHAINIDFNDFLRWYNKRDVDKTESPIYKITNEKGKTEYIVHDKIVSFEVNE